MPVKTTEVSKYLKNILENCNQKNVFVRCAAGLGIRKEKSQALLKSLEELNDLTEKLCRKDAGHHLPHLVTPEEYQQLLNLYRKSLDLILPMNQQLAELLEDAEKEQKPVNIILRFQNLLNSLTEILSKDQDQIFRVSELKEPKPLSLILYDSRKPVYNGELSKAKKIGAGQSRRRIVTIQDFSGEHHTGIFTPKSFVPYKGSSLVRNISTNQLMLKGMERLDHRSSAMSTAAVLLGRGDLLAHSASMDMLADGRRVEGTFMEFAPGTDINNMSTSDPYFRTEENSYLTASAMKDMMDLNILDFLCMNIDRHQANMFYQYKTDENNHTVLTGLKGIDNDSSFGRVIPSRDVNRLPAPENLCYISSSMADRIRMLNPQALRLALHPYDFSEGELAAACGRLILIQDMLRNGEELSRKLKNTDASGKAVNPQEPCLTEAERNAVYQDPYQFTERTPDGQVGRRVLIEIPDDQLMNIDREFYKKMPKRYAKEAGGVFCMVLSLHEEADRKRERKDAQKYEMRNRNMPDSGPQPENVFRPMVMNEAGLMQNCEREVADFLKRDQQIYRRFRGSSSKFKAVEKSLLELQNMMESMQEELHTLQDWKFNVLEEYCTRIDQECTEYLDKKDLEQRQGERFDAYTNSRIQFINDVQEIFSKMKEDAHGLAEAELLRSNMEIAEKAEQLKVKEKVL